MRLRRREQSLEERLRAGDVDWWEELYHQGDVFPETFAAAPVLVELLERGTDDDADVLYFLASAGVGRPEHVAAAVRTAAAAGAATYRRLLEAASEDVRAGAVALLAVVGPEPEDVERFAEIAQTDASQDVRSHAALALGLVPGTESRLEPLLSDQDVAHAAALALARLGRREDRVVQALADALVRIERSPTERAPWLELYPDWPEELTVLGEPARRALSTLLEALATTPPQLAAVVAEVALELARGSDQLRREVAAAIAAADPPWERAIELETTLPEHGLPSSRDRLREWARPNEGSPA